MTIRVRGPDESGSIRVYVDDRLYGVVDYNGKISIPAGLRRREHVSRWRVRRPVNGRRRTPDWERTYPSATMALESLLFDAALWTWEGFD